MLDDRHGEFLAPKITGSEMFSLLASSLIERHS